MCVCCKTVCTKTSVSPCSRYSPKPLSSHQFLFFFLVTHSASSTRCSPQTVHEHPAPLPDLQTHSQDLQHVYHWGPLSVHLLQKGLAITANGARLHRHCEGNDHVLTIGFQRKTHWVGKSGWGRRGGEWEQYAERSGNNMYLWKKN